ncbi:dimethylaniline monooxygenase 1 [Caerostris darwini]|uniref:Flavin-containing monooxygenase n=1 Tax=Caerostris darwini TaxID=1538125 RepID=A0AAV4UUD8_9ARAC|nr:dimethylaniline monooxygenase 1 [Caerostris darwini]
MGCSGLDAAVEISHVAKQQFHHKLYPVIPKYHFLARDPVTNDHIHSLLHSGVVIQKPDIERFTEDGVIFKGASEVTKADAVIMATGYTWGFLFLEDNIVVHEEDMFNLYKCMFSIHLKHATLAVIAFILPFGPLFMIAELQCRWVAQVFSGKCKLPSQLKMAKEVEKRYRYNSSRYSPSEKMWITYNIAMN